MREPRQRWRLTVARAVDPDAEPQRDANERWLDALEAAGLPIARAADARARPRVAFGAPLPAGMAAEADLIDVVLVERWPRWQVRDALAPHVPAGWRLVDLEDVWLAGPPLPGRVAAADYRIPVAAGGPDGVTLAAAVSAVMAASHIERERPKGDRTVAYDLRPLIVALRVAAAGPPPVLIARTRIHPERGTGRPEEVVAAIADRLGRDLPIGAIVRERLLLADELD